MARALLILLMACGASAAATTWAPQDTAPAGDDSKAAAAYTPSVKAASEEGASRLAVFRVGNGLAAHLWAAEPLLANPVCLTLDGQGAVYVGETFRHTDGVLDIRAYTDWLADDFDSETVEERVALMQRMLGDGFDAMDVEHERIRRLTDTTGDGKADTATIYADGFDQPAVGIGAGLLARDGDVYYACIPDLWVLRDTNGDGIADTRRVLSKGYGVRIGYLGHDLHGLRLGPDGRLYFSIGDRGLHVESGKDALHLPNTGAVLRCEPDGSGLEIVHIGLRNPQELAFNDFGDLFTGDNNADNGDRARIVQIVEGGDSGWRGPYQWVGDAGFWNSENRWHLWHPNQPTFLLPPIDHLTAGPSGFTHEPGTALTAEYADQFFLCDFQGTQNGSGVYAFGLTPEGAGFEMSEATRPFWGMLATDCEFGPDGALYVTDWVESWNKTGKGRVYRVSDAAPDAKRAALVAGTRTLLREGMKERSANDLAELLSHEDSRVRLDAQLELTTRGAKGLAALSLVARADPDRRVPAGGGVLMVFDRRDLPTLHAVWGLGVLARRDATRRSAAVDVLLAVAADRTSEVRAQALKVLGDLREPAATSLVLAGLSDAAPRVRFQAALASGRLELTEAVDPLVTLITDVRDTDPMLRHAAVMGLMGCAGTGRLDELARSDNRHVRMAALLVMRLRGSGAIARFLDDPEPLLVHEAARAIHDGPVAAAVPALADHLLADTWHQRFGIGGSDVPPPGHNDADDDPALDHALLWRRAMNAAYRIGTPERARNLVWFARRDDIERELRAEAVDILGVWGQPDPLDRLTGYHWPLPERDDAFVLELAVALSDVAERDTPDEVLTAWARLARGLAEGGSDAQNDAARRTLQALPEELMVRLASIVSNQDFGVEARIAALEALEVMEPANLKDIVAGAFEARDPEMRAAALSALEGLSLADAMPRLPALLAGGDMPEQRMALRILRDANDPRAEEWVANELRRLASGAYPAELVLDLVLAAEARESAAVDLLLARHNERFGADPVLDPWLDGIFGGNEKRGREVFERTQMQCVRCHEAPEGTTAVGPDLTGVGNRLARIQILEALLTPDRRTAPGYGASKIVLDDGTVLSGRIIEESADEDGAAIIRLQDAEGVVTEISAASVVDRQPGISAMPESLGAGLTREEMRDLIEYVVSL